MKTPGLPPNIDPGLYTDLNRLQHLKVPSAGTNPSTQRQVASQFESLFVNLMLKTMREANDALGIDNPLASKQTRFYRDMYDQQLAVELSQSGGLGLQDALMRQLSGSSSQQADLQSQAGLAGGAVTADQRNLFAERRLAMIRRPLVGSDSTMIESRRLSVADELISKPISASAMSIQSPNEFIDKLLPHARKAAKELGVDPRYLLAQAALETGWGQHMIPGHNGQSSYNLFGIKAHHNWGGASQEVATLEYRQGVAVRQQDQFRVYGNWSESFADYVDFLKENPRYQKALESSQNPERFLNELQKAGYATDPQYAAKIIRIAHGPRMEQALNSAG